MEREILLLLPLPAGVDGDSALVRRLFERWWQGAAVVALGAVEGWPMPVERAFSGAGVPLALRFWLWRRRASRVIVAGVGAAGLVAELRRLGWAAELPGGASCDTGAADAPGLLRPA
jgi:hypothetical protein